MYQVFASNLKRATSFGRLLGSVSFYIPSCQLHLWCQWVRDDRGHERVVLPRLEVEAPDGKLHRKTLVRFATAEAEERFQCEALRALHQLIAKTATSADQPTDPHRFAPLSAPAASLEHSALPQQQKDV
jgi:hypothetical protein